MTRNSNIPDVIASIRYYRLFICLLIILPFRQVKAQDVNRDSLNQVIRNGHTNEKIKALNSLANAVVYDQPAEAKQLTSQSIRLAKEVHDVPGLADAYTRHGIAHDVSGNYDSAIICYEQALDLYGDIGNRKGRGSALNNLGLIYWNLADYDKALDFFFRALKDFEDIGHDRYMANALNNIGLVYDDVHRFRDALQFHHRARQIYEKLRDHYLQGAVYNNLGNSYSNIGKYDSAEYYYLKSIDMQTIAHDDYGLSIAYSGYATLLDTLGQLERALDYTRKSLELKNRLNESSGQAIALINMASLQLKMHDRPAALASLEKARVIAEEKKLRKELMHIYLALSQFHETSNIPLSFSYYRQYTENKDSVFNENSNRQITELNTKYETGKKELKLREQDLLITRKNVTIAGIAGLLLLALVLGWLAFKGYRFKQQRLLQEERMKQQEQSTRAVLEAEENERKRIAAELHDGIGQMMSAAKMNLSVFESELDFNNEQQKKSFENVISLVDMSCREIRSVSHQMMPNALSDKGLAEAVREFIGRIDQKIIQIALHTEGFSNRLDMNTESILYRVIQESVNNTLKHAGAKRLDISMMQDNEGLSITIEDDGKGFSTTALAEYEGIGLKNIRSRILYLRGSVEIDSSPGNGTLVAIHIPPSTLG